MATEHASQIVILPHSTNHWLQTTRNPAMVVTTSTSGASSAILQLQIPMEHWDDRITTTQAADTYSSSLKRGSDALAHIGLLQH